MDEDEGEDEKDDLLDFEYRRNYVNNIEKRQRRWDTRWDALQQVVKCLPVKSRGWMPTFAVVLLIIVPCETDVTMALLAVPLHMSFLLSCVTGVCLS